MANTDSFIPLSYDKVSIDEMQRRSETLLSLYRKRRTVRTFDSTPIPSSILENIISAAATAPSGANLQPWFFALVTSSEKKTEIREAAEKEERESYEHRYGAEMLEDIAQFGVNETKAYLEEAPALIVVFKQNYAIVDGEKKKHYYVNESIGLASGLLLSAIHQVGLVTVTHTPSPMKFLNAILDRPKNEVPILLMPVGYPKKDTVVPNITKKPMSEIMKVY